MKVGLVGLGVIGSRVAAQLTKAKSLQSVFNRTSSKAKAFAKETGVSEERSVAELAQKCDVVITVLTNDSAVRDVMRSIFDGPLDGKTFIEMSTISPSTSAGLASELRGKGARMLDVPVVGSANAVEKGEAVLLVGGERHDFERHLPLLRAISSEVVYVGPNGSGLRLKLIHNLVLASYVVALGESINFGLDGDLDPQLIHKLLTSLSSIRSPNSAIKVPKILNSDYAVQFSLKNMIKDLEIILGEARLQGSPTPMTALAHQLYTLARIRGFSEEDFSVVAELLKKGSIPGTKRSEV
jgi:3-hydroxyisobutyrate dehydrogenase